VCQGFACDALGDVEVNLWVFGIIRFCIARRALTVPRGGGDTPSFTSKGSSLFKPRSLAGEPQGALWSIGFVFDTVLFSQKLGFLHRGKQLNFHEFIPESSVDKLHIWVPPEQVKWEVSRARATSGCTASADA
jgi:hypothetical protein